MNKKVLIADDHHVVRVGTAMFLKTEFKDISIEYAANYNEVKQKVKSTIFDLLILDIDMPGTLYKAMIKDLKAIQGDMKILIFSTYKNGIALQYIQEGADGFLNKLSDESSLIKSVKSIFEEGYSYPMEVIHHRMKNSGEKAVTEILSEREFQVFEQLAKGNGNIEIASILGIQIPTVGTYKKRIYEKLKVNNVIDLLKIYNEIH